MTLEELIKDALRRHEDDEIMLDAFVQWASNPTSMSAGYGVEENYPYIAENLRKRFRLSSEQTSSYIQELKHECDHILQSGEDLYQIRRQVLEQIESEVGGKWSEGIKRRINESPEELKKVIILLNALYQQGKYIVTWEGFEKEFMAYFIATYGSLVSPFFVRDMLMNIGLLNKLCYIPSKRKWERNDSYVFAPLHCLTSMGLELELSPRPDIPAYVEELFDKKDYEQLRTLYEVSEAGGFRIYYGEEPPSLVNVPGIAARYEDIIAISPFVLNKLDEMLRVRVTARLRKSFSDVDSVLVSLRNNLWPKAELKYAQVSEEKALWIWSSENNPSLYIYLIPWLTKHNISDPLCRYLTSDYAVLFLILYQSLPSIKDVLEKWWHFSHSSNASFYLLLIGDEIIHSEHLRGEQHPQAEMIMKLLKEKLEPGRTPKVPIEAKPAQPISPAKPTPTVAAPSPARPGTRHLRVLLGMRGAEEVFWVPADERSWNFAIVGSAGTGKTQTVKSVLKEFANQAIPYIVFDFRNDYVPVKSSISDFGSVLDPGKISINPLELDGSNSPRDQKYQISDIIALVYKIGERQIGYLREAIKLSYESKGIFEDDEATWKHTPPTFADIQENLERLADKGGRAEKESIKGIFARLDPIFDYGIFSAETVIPFEDLMKGQTVINLGILPNDKLKAVVCEFLLRKLRYYLYNLPESREPKLFIVIDEAHRLKYEKDSSAGQLLKEARKYGVGLVLSTQDSVDFSDLVYNNIGGILSLQLGEPKFAKSIAEHLGGRISWRSVKNDLSTKFFAFVKFSSQPDAIKLRVTPYYERLHHS